jgi:hypothetical protein
MKLRFLQHPAGVSAVRRWPPRSCASRVSGHPAGLSEWCVNSGSGRTPTGVKATVCQLRNHLAGAATRAAGATRRSTNRNRRRTPNRARSVRATAPASTAPPSGAGVPTRARCSKCRTRARRTSAAIEFMFRCASAARRSKERERPLSGAFLDGPAWTRTPLQIAISDRPRVPGGCRLRARYGCCSGDGAARRSNSRTHSS